MSRLTFSAIARRYTPELESTLQRYVPKGEGALSGFYGMLRYHLGWTDEEFNPIEPMAGKRLRPTLCLASCEAAGGDYHVALPAAAALELLHNYSLIHDDIEDRSNTRRHRTTVWKLWGEALAINAGDGLFTLARLAMLDLPKVGVDLSVAREAVRLFDETSLRLCEGQHLDIAFESMPSVEADLYLEMIGKKTASLIGCSAQIGALIATADLDQSVHYYEYGHSLGVAFQIQDDILGIWGNPDVTGKFASDVYQKKKTLPIIYALENASPSDRSLLAHLYQQQTLDDEQVARAVGILDRSGARQFAEAEARRYYRAAVGLLTSGWIGRNGVGYLQAIADFLAGRES